MACGLHLKHSYCAASFWHYPKATQLLHNRAGQQLMCSTCFPFLPARSRPVVSYFISHHFKVSHLMKGYCVKVYKAEMRIKHSVICFCFRGVKVLLPLSAKYFITYCVRVRVVQICPNSFQHCWVMDHLLESAEIIMPHIYPCTACRWDKIKV